jgi:hypothetical protein
MQLAVLRPAMKIATFENAEMSKSPLSSETD